MRKNQPYIHPLNRVDYRIKEEGIVILDDVRGLPSGDKPFKSPDYVISLTQHGKHQVLYDDVYDVVEEYSVVVIFPNHNLREVSTSEDYRTTLIVVDASMLDDPMLRIVNQLRYRYESHPSVKLSKREFRIIMNVVEGMREIIRLKLPDYRILLVRLLDFFLRLLSYYRKNNLDETNVDNRVSIQFNNDLVQHFREHHDVNFYAEKACLSTKHFSTVIKRETGCPAAYWIHSKIVAEAKMLLHMRQDLNIQAIADMLGFNEQATFSRYFRRETGMSPSEFRENI